MKSCPTCRKTYTDDNLNFCLEDGSHLTSLSSNLPETMVMNFPRPTDPSPQMTFQPGVQSTFGNEQPYTMQPPRKSSKAWLWVVGILGLVVLLCGGGLTGLVVLGMLAGDTAQNTPINLSGESPPPPTPSSSPFGSASAEQIDLSDWVKEFSVWGTTEFNNGEFTMASKQKGYYYVLVAPDDYNTKGSITRVTLRNIENAASSLGYGLIFHSDPTPLNRDYAFLIDTKRKKYRVVRHEPTKETVVVSWANSSAIKEGTAENVLEARDKGELVELYINGELATSVKNTIAPNGGVPGLYSGDAARIAFKKLEIAK